MFFRVFRKSVLACQKAINTIPFLEKIENYALKNYQGKDAQPVCIVGPPRTGSTLFYQLLLSYFKFAYISNIASLFYSCPTCVSNLSCKIFGEYKEKDYRSTYGYISGIMAPSEAGPLINRWLGDNLCTINLHKNQSDYTKRSIVRLSSIMGGPCLFKSLKLSLKMECIIELFPNTIFLYITRAPLYTAQSILLARRKLYNNESRWLSYNLPNQDELLALDPFVQVVYQIKSIQDYIEKGKQNVPSSQFLEVKYEEFCHDPERIMNNIEQQFANNGIVLERKKFSGMNIEKSEHVLLSQKEWEKLRSIVSQIL